MKISRIDIVGQNGNEGEHYEQDKKPGSPCARHDEETDKAPKQEEVHKKEETPE